MKKLEEYKKLVSEFYVWREKLEEVMENKNDEWDDIRDNMSEDDEWFGCVYGSVDYFLKDNCN